MRWLTAQVEEQVFLPPASRLAGKLHHLMDDTSHVLVSQAQLADIVDITRAAVPKILSDCRRNGPVALPNGLIQVRGLDTLRMIPCCC